MSACLRSHADWEVASPLEDRAGSLGHVENNESTVLLLVEVGGKRQRGEVGNPSTGIAGGKYGHHYKQPATCAYKATGSKS